MPAQAEQSPITLNRAHDRHEEDLSTEKALQTVSAGQKAENLLDFDADDIMPVENSLAGAFSSTASAPATAASRAPAANPIDDLLSLFNNMPTAPSTAPVDPVPMLTPGSASTQSMNGLNGLSALRAPSHSPSEPHRTASATAQPQSSQSDDLLGLF